MQKIYSVQHFRDKYPVTPLDHALSIINAPLPPKTIKQGKETVPNPEYRLAQARQDDLAKAAMPFLHARLSSIEMKGEDGGPVRHTLDVTKLTDEELTAMEKIVAKAQTTKTIIEDAEYEDLGTH